MWQTMPTKLIVLLLLLLLLHCHLGKGQTDTDARTLRNELFVNQSYDKRIRPVSDHTLPIRIFVNFHLLALNEVNALQETLRLTAYLQLKWNDEFLSWDPNGYGGLQSYHWPQNEVWKPVIALRNSYLDYKALGDVTLDVQNWNDGEITWLPFQVFTSTCSMVVTYYPFDTQTCHIKFVAWGYNKDEVAMAGGDLGIVLDDYEPNPQWELLNSSWTVVYGIYDVTITFTMTMKRVPSYVMFTVLLPVLLLTMLNIFVFILPCESGERVGYAVTVFLSFAVFFTLISGVLPESVALFTIYVIIMTAQSAVICMIAIVQVRLSCNEEQERPVPKWLVFISNLGECTCLTRFKRRRKIATRNTTPVKILKNPDKDVAVDDLGDQSTDGSEDFEERATWKKTIAGIDYVLTLFFTLVSVIVTATCLGICATAD